MEQYWLQFLTVIVVHFLAVASPGPDFMVVTKNAVSHSRKTGIWTALGVGAGISVHVAYCLLGIGFIISQSIVLFNIIKLIGAAYLIYIGYKAIRSKPHVATAETVVEDKKVLTHFQAFKSGFLVNVLNPKATLFFLALFTQVIDPGTPMLIKLAYGMEMMVATTVWFSIVALVFSNEVLKQKIHRIQHHIDRVTGVVLIGLGIKVALSDK